MRWPNTKSWAGNDKNTSMLLPSTSLDLKRVKYWASNFRNLETVEAHEEAGEATIVGLFYI